MRSPRWFLLCGYYMCNIPDQDPGAGLILYSKPHNQRDTGERQPSNQHCYVYLSVQLLPNFIANFYKCHLNIFIDFQYKSGVLNDELVMVLKTSIDCHIYNQLLSYGYTQLKPMLCDYNSLVINPALLTGLFCVTSH